ncbi:MAG TPA: ferritin-like domain-containing protein [Chthoniobacteraceae bacterium]|jgi:ferritin-like metal-binding protein YciE
MNAKDELIDWLRDAYAMERGLEITLQKQAANAELNSTIREQARLHLEETKRHAEAVHACLEQLGADTSALKTGLAKMLEIGKGLGTTFASDERVKDLLAAYASEHFEIACYKALRAGALEIGHPEIAAVCDSILPDEERMAGWLDANLSNVVSGYLRETQAAS